jgi:nucleoside-diphosphate-sugar epimerase
MASSAPKILLTGATGYIGGSILNTILSSSAQSLQGISITCLLRGPDRAAKLTATYGSRVKPVFYEGLDDLETTISIASQHDIVINTTLGYHVASAKALVQGLGQRKAETGRDVWIIHTAGCSNLGDMPITHPERVRPLLDDAKDDVYGVEKALEAEAPYSQRTTELAVIDTGLELGVKTLSIMSSIIYGNGTGLFNKISIQTSYLGAVLKQQQARVVGPGTSIWNHVHVEDLAELYALILSKILENGGKNVPTGKNGIIFSGTGEHTWKEYTTDQAEACYAEGLIPSPKVEHVSLEEGARLIAPHMDFMAAIQSIDEGKGIVEVGFASNGHTIATVGRELGWTPRKGEDAWKAAFREDARIVAADLGIERN